MSGLLRGSGGKQNWVPFYNGLQLQTSSNGVPITILYGTNKTSSNYIWTGGFFAIAQYQKQGGKGGGKQLQGYNYYTSFAMGICEGPIYSYGQVWEGSTITNFYWGDLPFAAYGTTPQAPWGFLAAAFPLQALHYNGLAYAGSIAFPLGSSPQLPQISFEVFGRLFTSSVVNGFDADPALIIQDFLTNAQYGVLFPPATLDATTLLGSSGGSSYQIYCQALGLAMSPVLANQEAANSILARWLQLTNSAAVWSGGKLKFIPYGDTSVTGPLHAGGNVTFNPNVTTIYDLADDDFIHEDGKDPLEIVRSDPYNSHNWQRVQISQRTNFYDATPIDVWDQNAIELYGLRRASDITASEICDPAAGQTAAQLILQRQLYIRNTYKFKLSFEYCLLDPMDLVTITDSDLGLRKVAVRITGIEEDDAGILAVTAEEFPSGIAHSVLYQVQNNNSNNTNQGVIPARANAPVIYEPPAVLTGGLPALTGAGAGSVGSAPIGSGGNVSQVWVALSGGIATAYKLAEDSSFGVHSTNQAINTSQPIATAISFSVYALAVERSALRLNLYNGSATIGCDFNLATGVAGTPDAGISAATIANAGGGTSSPVTILIASPAVITWTGNNFVGGQAVYFTTTGALPTGLTPNTIYYAIPITANTFAVAATPGGAAINTSGCQSGVQTGVTDIWYQCSIAGAMAAAAVPTLTIFIESTFGSIASYTGITGDGIYIWGAEFSAGSNAPTFLPAFFSVTGATLAVNGVVTPEGVAGVADPNWGGAFIWLSTDGTTYGQIGVVNAPARQGFLTANLAAPPGGNPDIINMLSVSLVESGGMLPNATQADAQNGLTLCLVDNELLAYGTATLTGADAYDLTYLYRGLYGTTPAAHFTGAPFARLDGAIFQYTLPAQFIGVLIYMKFQSFNIFGNALEDLSECVVYTYTPNGQGQGLGPVSKALAAGANLDFGLVSQVVAETDQWGLVAGDAIIASIELGTVV
jgi:Putative phage tail protein